MRPPTWKGRRLNPSPQNKQHVRAHTYTQTRASVRACSQASWTTNATFSTYTRTTVQPSRAHYFETLPTNSIRATLLSSNFVYTVAFQHIWSIVAIPTAFVHTLRRNDSQSFFFSLKLFLKILIINYQRAKEKSLFEMIADANDQVNV